MKHLLLKLQSNHMNINVTKGLQHYNIVNIKLLQPPINGKYFDLRLENATIVLNKNSGSCIYTFIIEHELAIKYINMRII